MESIVALAWRGVFAFGKKSIVYLLTATFVIGTMMAGTAHAVTVIFDQSAYNKDVWFQIQDPNFSGPDKFQGGYAGGTQIDFSSSGGDTIMSKPIKLSDIGTGGLEITKAIGTVFFIYYDDPTNESRTAPPSQIISTKRFQTFELTVTPVPGDQGDLTAINYFTAPMSIKSYQNDPITDTSQPVLQQTGYGSYTGTQIGDLMRSVTAGDPDAVIKNSKGMVVRYLGPSNYNGANPWPSFIPYAKAINASGQTTHLDPVNSFNFPGQPLPVYTFGADMNATADADGNITMSGAITVSLNGENPAGNPSPPASGRWENVTISFSVADADAFNNAVYGQIGTNSAVTFTGTGWDLFQTFTDNTHQDGTSGTSSLNDVPLNVNATIKNLFVGELTTGLLGGFINSDYQVNGTAIKDMNSTQWWQLDPMVAFSTIQPDHPYYSTYSEIIYRTSGNTVYGVPYSDRFGNGPDVSCQIYNTTPVNYWVIGIAPPLGAQTSIVPTTLEMLLLSD